MFFEGDPCGGCAVQLTDTVRAGGRISASCSCPQLRLLHGKLRVPAVSLIALWKLAQPSGRHAAFAGETYVERCFLWKAFYALQEVTERTQHSKMY